MCPFLFIPFLSARSQTSSGGGIDAASLRDSSNPWAEAHSGIGALSESIGSLLLVILILGGIFTLTTGIIKMMKGDRDSGERMLLWFIGFLIGSTLLTIFF